MNSFPPNIPSQATSLLDYSFLSFPSLLLFIPLSFLIIFLWYLVVSAEKMASMKLIAVLMVSLCLIAPLTHATDVTYCSKLSLHNLFFSFLFFFFGVFFWSNVNLILYSANSGFHWFFLLGFRSSPCFDRFCFPEKRGKKDFIIWKSLFSLFFFFFGSKIG